MVLEIYFGTGDLDLVKKAFPSLLKEHNFWMSGLLFNSANIRNVLSVTLFEALFERKIKSFSFKLI
jgi:alpha,alpha-trehalase